MSNPRSEVPAAFRWRLEDIYPADEAWEQEFTLAKQGVDAFGSHAGTLGTADGLLACLKEQSRLSLLIERLYVYAHMRRDEDNGNTKYVGMTDRAAQLIVAMETAASFVTPEVLGIPSDELRAWCEREAFASFRFGLEDIDRVRAHRLNAAEERLLAMAEHPLGGAQNIFTMLNNVDLDFGTIENEKGEEVRLTHGSYGMLLESADRRVRRDAYHGMYAQFDKYKNTISTTYVTSVNADVFRARARGYAGAIEHALFENNVPVSVYEQLIEAMHESIPALTRYTELRKRMLQLDELEMYDLYTPMLAECEMPMRYDEAKALVKLSLSPLGERYGTLLDRAFSESWIDVLENDGKTSGAYSWGAYGVHPYILLNHQDNVDHAMTLAHELGHAMHTFHSDEALPYELAQYRIMVAEVASTVNEVLTTRYLIDRETDTQKKAYLLNQFLEQFRTTCFRQTMFAEFELKAHRMAEAGEALTVDSLSDLYRKLNELYYPNVHVDDNIALEWMRIPHFYRPFYVYQYATGFCAAVKLATDILEHDGRERYLAFLSSGGSDYPIRLLQRAGVDLTDKQSILSSMAVFAKCVDELTALLS